MLNKVRNETARGGGDAYTLTSSSEASACRSRRPTPTRARETLIAAAVRGHMIRHMIASMCAANGASVPEIASLTIPSGAGLEQNRVMQPRVSKAILTR